MKTSKKYGKFYDYDPETDYPKIKAETKRKLDEILSDPNYLENIAKKYYGAQWMKAIPDDHFLKTEYKKAILVGDVMPVNTSDKTKKLYWDTPIIQTDKKGNVTEWKSAMEYCEAVGKRKTAANEVIRFARGRHPRDWVFKSKWEFKYGEE